MANPTTNYGFVLPTPTDLVTDLPADFDVALQGVDTRLKALQPGTTLGDIAYSSATANTNTRLGIGSTGQVLTVASGVPSWATPASGIASLSGAGLNNNTTQSLSNGTNTAISFQAESFDTDAYHSTSTNISRITVPAGKAGYYLINGCIMYASNSSGQRQVNVYKNGGNVAARTVIASSGGVTQINISFVLSLAVADYVELYGYQDSGGALNVVNDTPGQVTYFSAVLIGA
jgi:hypothetical protein